MPTERLLPKLRRIRKLSAFLILAFSFVCALHVQAADFINTSGSTHRVEPAPGIIDIDAVINECTAKIVDRYASKTLEKQ